MNKQELIDNAVVRFKGKWPICDPTNLNVLQYAPDLDGTTYYPYYFDYAHEHNDLCTREEFDQRARELGWVNGYQWGVEYPTNGKKPDLPAESLKLELKNRHFDTVVQSCDSNFVNWENVKSFRIVDERHKPKDESSSNPQLDNSWHERGELPPVGVNCEAKLNGEWMPVFVVGKNSKGYLVFEPLFDWGFSYDSYGNDALNFRPIKSDRERFIDAALDGFDKVSDEFPPAKNDWLKKLFGGMFDAGFRAPSDKG